MYKVIYVQYISETLFLYFSCTYFSCFRFKDHELTSHKCCHEVDETIQQRAILISLAITYYFRLNSAYRKEYVERMGKTYGSLDFEQVLEDEVRTVCICYLRMILFSILYVAMS